MLPTVNPTTPHPTADLLLDDGTTQMELILCDGQGKPDRRAIHKAAMPRTAMQINTGDPQYSSYEMPYTPLTQKALDGGRGQVDYNKDGSRYLESFSCDTRGGDLILAGNDTRCTTFLKDGTYYQHWEAEVALNATTDYARVATRWTCNSNITVKGIALKLRALVRWPDVAGGTNARVTIYSDDAQQRPDVLLAASSSINVYWTDMQDAIFVVSYTFVAGTTYHIVLEPTNHEVTPIAAALSLSEGGTTKVLDVPTWTLYTVNGSSTVALNFGLIDAASPDGGFFFDYRRTKMYLSKPDSGGAPRLYMNGYHGMALDNAADKTKLNTTLTLPGGTNLAGKWVKLVSGPGSEEETNWRGIYSNTTGANAVIAVWPPWNITHTTSTEYAIQGCENWEEITGHGGTVPPTDVQPMDDFFYWCQGEAALKYIRRGKFTLVGNMNDPTKWSWADDGTNQASYMTLVNDTTGKIKVFVAKATVSGVYKADTAVWGTPLVFTQVNNGKPCGNPRYKITNLIAYGSPQCCWVIREDGFGSIDNDVYSQVPLAELATVPEERNGLAACTFGVYLFFSLYDGFDRYYNDRLDDIGPNLDAGMPYKQRGIVSQAVPYPGGILIIVDGGASNASSILFWNQRGWHELYRSRAGRRIRAMGIQSFPGNYVDRLWFSLDGELYYLPMVINPMAWQNYPYHTFGYAITSWYTGNFREIRKFLDNLTLFTEFLKPDLYEVRVQYQLEEETALWQDLPDSFDTSPINSVPFSTNDDQAARRWRLRLMLYASPSAQYASPRVFAWTMDTVTRVRPKRGWTVTFLADDAIVGINGQRLGLSADGLLSKLDEWADSETRPTPVLMRSATLANYDNLRVFIDPDSIQMLGVTPQRKRAAITMTIYQK